MLLVGIVRDILHLAKKLTQPRSIPHNHLSIENLDVYTSTHTETTHETKREKK